MIRSLALAAVLVAVAVPASAQAIRFSAPVAGDRLDVAVRTLTGEPAQEAAIVDLDDDKSGEIAVRTDCREGSCRTRLFKSRGGEWATVLDVRATKVELGEPGMLGMRSVSVDDGAFSYGALGYSYDMGKAGVPLEFSVLPPEKAAVVAAQFGEGAATLVSSGRAKVEAAAANPHREGSAVLVARLTGRGVCGLRMGCPVRVLSISDGAYVPLLVGLGEGKVAVSSSSVRADWADLVVQRPEGGYGVYAWTGASYIEVNAR